MTSDILKHAAEVPRYKLIGYDHGVEASATGRWVSYSDMAAAIAERDVENARLTARSEAAEAQVANAGAVMVEACALANEKRGSVFGRDAAAVCRTLSTLSPIAAAARVLLAQTEAANDPEIGPWLRALVGQEKAEGFLAFAARKEVMPDADQIGDSKPATSPGVTAGAEYTDELCQFCADAGAFSCNCLSTPPASVSVQEAAREVATVARAILKARFFDIEPECYDHDEDVFFKMVWDDHGDDAEAEAEAAIAALRAIAEGK